MRRSLVLVATLLCPALLVTAQPRPRARQPPTAPPRDTSARPPAATATARIFGRVTDAGTADGLRGAIVTIRPVRGAGGIGQMSARADADGSFMLRDLPEGEYSVVAQKPGYVPQGLGQASPLTPPRQLVLGPGAIAGPLEFTLLRGGVVTGRVVDDQGSPAEGVQVRASKLRRFASEWRLIPYGQPVMTDDLGEYRIHSLPPGAYVIGAAPPRHARSSDQPGDAAREPDLVPTYAPTASAPAAATRVRVTAGSESQADIALVVARTASISGRVVDGGGAAVTDGRLSLQVRGPVQINPFVQQSIERDGTFSFDGVPPGPYTLTVEQRAAGGTSPAMTRPAAAAWIEIDVDGADLTGLVLRPSQGRAVHGRLVVDGDPAALAGREVQVVATPATTLPIPGVSQARVAAGGAFTLEGLHGPVVVRINGVPAGWWTRAIRLGDRDVTEGFDPAHIRGDEALEVVVSTKATALRGVVRPLSASRDDAVVVMFVADARRWEESPRAAGIAVGRPIEDGTFRIPGVRPGRYHVVAVPAGAIGDEISDPEFLRALSARAQLVDVHEGEAPSVELTVVEP